MKRLTWIFASILSVLLINPIPAKAVSAGITITPDLVYKKLPLKPLKPQRPVKDSRTVLLPDIYKPQIIAPPELTIEQKVEQNVNGCDLATEWIRADNAECIPAEDTTVQPIALHSASNANNYAYLNCTWYVAGRRAVPPHWGNAVDWMANASAEGYKTSDEPLAGAIAWQGSWVHPLGHVAYVEAVYDDGTILVSEYNYIPYSYSERRVPKWEFNYIW